MGIEITQTTAVQVKDELTADSQNWSVIRGDVIKVEVSVASSRFNIFLQKTFTEINEQTISVFCIAQKHSLVRVQR